MTPNEQLFIYMKDKGLIKGFETYEQWCSFRGEPVPEKKHSEKFIGWFNELPVNEKEEFKDMFGNV